jgi:C-terminal processing protease CtpA/Prc
MPLTEIDRTKILKSIRSLVVERHINVTNPHQDYAKWTALVDERTPHLVKTEGTEEFERGVEGMLAALGGSHTAFFQQHGAKVPPPHAINATLRAIETRQGSRWMFLDVVEDGPAFRSGIRPGELLFATDGNPVAPPAQPGFRIGGLHDLEIGTLAGDTRRVSLEVPDRQAKGRPPMVEPRSLSHRMIASDVGYLKVATFPGAVGRDFARALDLAIKQLKEQGAHRLIVDLRGNMGGGLGSLRLMSYFCDGKREIGHSLTRRRLQKGYHRERLIHIGKIPSSKLALLTMALRFRFIQKDRSMVLVTEGLGPQPFHGRIALLVNEHSRSAAEMVASFAKDNGLAVIVGTKTPGEVLGAANFKLAGGYRLRMPVAGWYTWRGECLKGKGVEPDVPVEVSPETLATGVDTPLERALNVLVKGLHTHNAA